MSTVTVILSEQDLSEFLEDNQDYMDKYVAELSRRLAESFDTVIVEVDSNALSDKIDIDGERDDEGIVGHIMNLVVNDWSWLN